MTATTYTEADELREQLDANATRAPQVLLIAPDAEKVSALSQVLEVDGFMCTTFEEPALGLAFARQQQPDLAVVDTELPQHETLMLIAALRRERTPEHRWPILALGASFSASLRRSVILMGANEYIGRPYDAVEVVLRIRRLLRVQRALAALEERPAFHVDVHAIHHELARLRARGHAGDPVRHDLDDDFNAVRSWRRRGSLQ